MGPQLVITVDADLRSDTVATRRETLDVLLGVFEDTGVAGHATWYLNENDFHITAEHPGFLREALRRGDTLGIHDHIDFMDGAFGVDAVEEYCSRSKTAVEGWLREHGRPRSVIHHRNGCLVQRPSIYEALRNLEYRVVSDVWPGNTRPGRRTGGPRRTHLALPPLRDHAPRRRA